MLKILFLNKMKYVKDLQQNYAFTVEIMDKFIGLCLNYTIIKYKMPPYMRNKRFNTSSSSSLS